MRSYRAVRSTRRCACLLVSTARPCTYHATARVVFRALPGARIQRVDACGVHDHLLAIELADRRALDVVVKAFVRPRRRRAGAQGASSV